MVTFFYAQTVQFKTIIVKFNLQSGWSHAIFTVSTKGETIKEYHLHPN